jgi:hypothetical protein
VETGVKEHHWITAELFFFYFYFNGVISPFIGAKKETRLDIFVIRAVNMIPFFFFHTPGGFQDLKKTIGFSILKILLEKDDVFKFDFGCNRCARLNMA